MTTGFEVVVVVPDTDALSEDISAGAGRVAQVAGDNPPSRPIPRNDDRTVGLEGQGVCDGIGRGLQWASRQSPYHQGRRTDPTGRSGCTVPGQNHWCISAATSSGSERRPARQGRSRIQLDHDAPHIAFVQWAHQRPYRAVAVERGVQAAVRVEPRQAESRRVLLGPATSPATTILPSGWTAPAVAIRGKEVSDAMPLTPKVVSIAPLRL